MRPLFDEFSRLSREHGFELIIVCHPASAQVEAGALYDKPQRRLLKICADLDIPCLDLLPPLRQAYQDSPDDQLFYDTCHHTPHASTVVARQIYRFLATAGTP